MLATRQLAVMLRSGVPLVRALEVVQGNDDEGLNRAFEEIAQRVSQGVKLSIAMQRHPLIFARIYTVMVRIGESTGGLVSSLEVLAIWLERDQGLRAKVVKALTYPAFVLALTVVLTFLVMWQVIPPFLQMFRQSGAVLPLPTRLLMLIADGVRQPLLWLLLGGGAYGYFELLRRRWQSEEGACEIYRAFQRIPVLGWMLTSASLSRWAMSLEAMMSAGVDIQTSLRLAGQAAGNPRLARDGKEAARALEQGDDLSIHLERQNEIYPRCVVHLVKAGEESSRLPAMLRRCAEIYGQELEFQVELLGAALEPLLLSSVAVIVGFVLVAIFLPMYSLIDRLG